MLRLTMHEINYETLYSILRLFSGNINPVEYSFNFCVVCLSAENLKKHGFTSGISAHKICQHNLKHFSRHKSTIFGKLNT